LKYSRGGTKTHVRNMLGRRGPDTVDAIMEQWRRVRPDLDPSPMGILARIARIEVMKKASQERVFAQYNLSPGLFDVLAALRRSGPPYRLTPSELAAATMLTTGGMTGRLDKLEAAGLIVREPDRGDRRVVFTKLTDEGLALIDRVVEEHLANEERLLAGLTRIQREQLASGLAACEKSVAEAVAESSRDDDT
jgi:DNA-binding MarR family transcriptional regulator